MGLTVDIDEHIFGGTLPEAAEAGDAEERACVVRSGPVDGEALLHVEGDFRTVDLHLLWGKLTV